VSAPDPGEPDQPDRSRTTPRPSPSRRSLRTARGIVALGVGEIVGKLATLVLVIDVARTLGPSEFGVFSFALALGTLVSVLPSWGFDTLLVQQGSGRPHDLPRLLVELLVLRTLIALPVLVVVGAALIAARGGGATGWATVLVLLACLIDTLADGYRAVATAVEAQGRCAVVQIVQRVLGAGLVILVLAAGGGLLPVSASYLLGSLVGLVGMAGAVAHLGVRPRLRSVSRAGIRDFSRVSWTMGVHSVVTMALFRIDAVMLGVLAGDTAVGLYAAAYRLLETVLFVAHNVSRAVFPVMASASDNAAVQRAWHRGLAVLSTVFVPYAALLTLRGGDVLELFYGPRFTEGGVAIMAWLAWAPLLFGIAFLAADVLLARRPDTRILLGSGGALALNVVLNLVLIPSFGGLGAAVATTISFLLEAAVLGWLALRLLGGRITLWMLAGPGAGTACAAAVLATPLPLLPALLLATPAYVAGWWPVTRRLDPEQTGVIVGLVRGRTAG
jgi:O-antigen/teichoic acid export membrane protein